MELCERLSQMRKAHSFTQMELAEALGVSRQAVSKWEVGSSVPSTDNLIRLSQLYGITLAELLDSQSQWQQAKSNLIEAKTQYKIYETQYLRATGTLE